MRFNISVVWLMNVVSRSFLVMSSVKLKSRVIVGEMCFVGIG